MRKKHNLFEVGWKGVNIIICINADINKYTRSRTRDHNISLTFCVEDLLLVTKQKTSGEISVSSRSSFVRESRNYFVQRHGKPCTASRFRVVSKRSSRYTLYLESRKRLLWFVDMILIDFTKIYLMIIRKFWNKTEKQLTTFYQITMHPSSIQLQTDTKLV